MTPSSLDKPCLYYDGEFGHHPIFERKGGAFWRIACHEHMHMGIMDLCAKSG